MPTLEISEAVYGMIRSLARRTNETDEEILQRVLSQITEQRDAALKAYEQSERDITSTN